MQPDTDTLMSGEYPGEHTAGDSPDEWRYNEWPCRIFSIASLIKQVEDKSLCYYVWPYEGQFSKHGNWNFHKGKIMDGETEIDAPTVPLLVDMQSANAFKMVYAAVNDKNKAKLAEFAQSRGLFCWAMNDLVWPNVKFGG